MYRALRHVFRDYRLFGLVLVASIAALILELSGQHLIAHWLLAITAIAATLPLLWDMIQNLRAGTYGVDILAATAIITSVVMRQYWTGIVIVLMLTGGEALEDYAERRAHRELDALLKRAPSKAHVLRGRKAIDLPVDQVRVGDKLIIRPGEVVPVDAAILEGIASFDESSLTGESLPQIKKAGDQILSGSINIDGAITVRAVQTAADSQYEQIIKLVQAAARSQAPFVRLADRYSIPFTIVSFGIAGTAWAISGQAIRFLEVLVVATPCPLILAAPVAVISGMSRSTKQGIIVKTGASLERLAQTKTMAFDKTGTLTKGELIVQSINTFGSYRRGQILSIAASLEQNSNHVLASAIVSKARTENVKITKVKNARELAGSGITATVSGNEVLVGRLGLLEEYRVSVPKTFKPQSLQATAAFVSVDGKLAGIITFKDELRPESKTTLERLRALGVKNLLMITGDNRATARAIAKQLGINKVVAEALPTEKLLAIEQIPERPVAFVGDGVNDAPVLAASDAGIALGARGSTAASESADIVIMPDDISRVATAVEIAKRTFFIAKQSILIGIALSVGLMFIFATGKFPPLYGAIIQEFVDVVVIFNALRAHSGGTGVVHDLPKSEAI